MRAYTDENNMLSTNQIISELNDQGVACVRKTLYKDIKLLNECGYEIMCKRGTQNLYYIVDRNFDIPELKILLDAVSAASFITEKKTKQLCEKIAALGGSYWSEFAMDHVIYSIATKSSNERIFYTIDTFNRAIKNKKKIEFRYFDYDTNGCRVYRKNKKYYIENPLTLVYEQNFYYLVAYSEERKKIINYRVDRMDNAVESTQDLVNADKVSKFNISDYKSKIISMYGGDEESVTLKAENEPRMIDNIYDKFGSKIKFDKLDDAHFTFTIKVQISPMFYAWYFMFGKKIEILSPEYVVKEYQEMKK